jgi:hypothetical protein
MALLLFIALLVSHAGAQQECEFERLSDVSLLVATDRNTLGSKVVPSVETCLEWCCAGSYLFLHRSIHNVLMLLNSDQYGVAARTPSHRIRGVCVSSKHRLRMLAPMLWDSTVASRLPRLSMERNIMTKRKKISCFRRTNGACCCRT